MIVKTPILLRVKLISLALPMLLPSLAAAADLKLQVSGETRVVRIYEPSAASETPVPLVLAFHGYDDDRHHFSRYVDLHKAWPEALLAFPQGMRLPDRDGTLRAKGWQTRKGMVGDRDLLMVDRLLDELTSRYTIDKRRVYATGMSNGGRFVFLLWAERAEMFAAFAPVAIAATESALRGIVEPRPVLYMIGKQEPQWRLRDAGPTVETISRINRSGEQAQPWGDYVSFDPLPGGADFVFNLHRAGHVWPSGASDAIVRFFKQHQMPVSVTAQQPGDD
ncbi:MAG: hypothetical protein HKO64_00235 [Xanthomonadales bacterium]|nr:hypothetical protein [Xanthomonadales bacterium]NNL94022.1 hypothetical protein [Xanthomonadales bacterium]